MSYFKPDFEDYVTMASILAKIYMGAGGPIPGIGGSDAIKKEMPDGKDCNGIIKVSGYTKGNGTEVEPYERICPYPHDGKGQENIEKSFEVKQDISSNRPANTGDVINVKQNLSKLGYYKSDPRSEPDGKFHGYPNDNLMTAIKGFQRDNKLVADGVIMKGGPTERALNDKFEFKGFTFKDPINVNKNQIAVFDGKSLSIYENDKKIQSWNGVAGKDGFQTKEFQNIKDKGPLPEGIYIAKQEGYQEHKDISWLDKRISSTGLAGSWRGGTDSWGNQRVWLEPAKQNNMFGRSGFSIHGGKDPGSLGCIDLTSLMSAFSKWFKSNGKDVILKVRY
ncbi:MAG: DUF2778 domain-containing protein [Alphaproteobacteria bacterium]|nr:DUF2778 domain-containing protein [Alphaproteobacteria bacterium]